MGFWNVVDIDAVKDEVPLFQLVMPGPCCRLVAIDRLELQGQADEVVIEVDYVRIAFDLRFQWGIAGGNQGDERRDVRCEFGRRGMETKEVSDVDIACGHIADNG